MEQKLSKQIRVWLGKKGKVWLFRILIIAGLVIVGLAEFNILPSGVINVNTTFMVTLGSLLLFLEIFLDEVDNINKLNQDGLSLEWNSAVTLIREDVQQARHVLIIGRSGETSYYALRDILMTRGSKLTIELVLTSTPDDNEGFIEYQTGWIKRWEKLFEESNSDYVIKKGKALYELSGQIIDRKIGYLSYRDYRPVNLRNLVRCTEQTNQGRFLIEYFLQWSEKVTTDSKDG